jgi:hypothetical protein
MSTYALKHKAKDTWQKYECAQEHYRRTAAGLAWAQYAGEDLKDSIAELKNEFQIVMFYLDRYTLIQDKIREITKAQQAAVDASRALLRSINPDRGQEPT